MAARVSLSCLAELADRVARLEAALPRAGRDIGKLAAGVGALEEDGEALRTKVAFLARRMAAGAGGPRRA